METSNSPNQNKNLPSSERNWKPESTQPSMWEKPPRAPGLNNWSQGFSLGPNNIGLSLFTTLDFSHIPAMVEGKRKIEGNMYWFLMVKTWSKPQKSQYTVYIYPSNSSLVLTRMADCSISFWLSISTFSTVCFSANKGKQSANAYFWQPRCGCFQRKNWCVSRSPRAADSGAACIMKELGVLGGSSHLVSGL